MRSGSMFHLAKFPARVVAALKWRVGVVADFLRFRKGFTTYRHVINVNAHNDGRVLFVAGRGMNVGWAQMWTYLSLSFAVRKIEPCVLILRQQLIMRLYFWLVGAKIFTLEDALDGACGLFSAEQLAGFSTVKQWKEYYYKNMPVGQMALSTYCRYHATGFIEPNNEAFRAFATKWVQGICLAYEAASKLYRIQKIDMAVFSETFIEEYGGFYYAALACGLDVIKTSGTVRDNAIVVQRRSKQNERLHHAALTDSAWEIIKQLPDFEHIKHEVNKNFSDRYGDKWLRSKRNFRDTKIVSREEGRAELGLADDRKIVVVYSHILYDAMFHYGDELFQDYATWLIETVKVAVENQNVFWYIKLHPSNLWRGEFHSMLGGKYEEEKIISQHVGPLPPHVRLIYADTQINPFSWYQIADYGISVRGTSGLEMACLGKPVITAGTGRYEGKGFTVDPSSTEEYRSILRSLPDLPSLTIEQTESAMRYAHGLFNMKPFTLASLEPKLKFGKRQVRESDDIIYIPQPPADGNPLPSELLRFADYIADKRQIDLLTGAKD